MLRGWLALASVHLCFVCRLAAVPLQPNLCSPDIYTNVQTLINSSDLTLLDCRLYTPTIPDYENCPSSTMKCFAEEIKVLIFEWETIPQKGFSLNKKLHKLAARLTQTESGCHHCEFSREENAEEFLKGLRNAIQAMNARYCTKKQDQGKVSTA